VKDVNDNATLDAFAAPRRGRPKTGNALSNADKQRAYRERKKASKQVKERTQGAFKPVDMTLSELCHIIAALDSYTETMCPQNAHRLPMHNALLERLIAVYPKHARDRE